MSMENIKIVEEFIEQVINQKRLERLPDFCSEEAICHAPPYVGLGVNFDDTSGEKLVLAQIAPTGPAHGHLKLGDELVRVRSGEQTWESFEPLRRGLWARGLIGSEITITVRRQENMVTIPLKLSRIDQFDIRLSEFYKMVIPYLQQYWPDLRMDIRQIFGVGDMVTCYAVNHGTNLEFHRSAVWSKMDLFKLRDGRITDLWSVENALDELTQLGYQVSEPLHEMA